MTKTHGLTELILNCMPEKCFRVYGLVVLPVCASFLLPFLGGARCSVKNYKSIPKS
jgi:hypothetical protein